MSRAAVWKLLTEDPEIVAMGFGPDNMYGNNSIDSLERKGPFMVLAWGETPPQDRLPNNLDIEVTELRVWVHSNKYQTNDYGAIRVALDRVKVLLADVLHLPGTDNRVLSHCDWRGDSADLTDDVLNTLTRNSTFRVVSRKA